MAEIDEDTFAVVMRIIFAGNAEPLLDLPVINTYQAAVMLEVMKDFLYQAYVRKGRLQHAMKVRKFFVQEAAARRVGRDCCQRGRSRCEKNVLSAHPVPRVAEHAVPAGIFTGAIRPPGILRVAERTLGMRHGDGHAAIGIGDGGDAER